MKGISDIKSILSDESSKLQFRKTIFINFITMLIMTISILVFLNYVGRSSLFEKINYFSVSSIILISMIFFLLFIVNFSYLKGSILDQADKKVPDKSNYPLQSYDFSELCHNLSKVLNKSIESYGRNHISIENNILRDLEKIISHDIRKPFSMLNHYLIFIQDINDPEEIRETTSMFADEMEKAIDSVDNLIKILLENDYEFKLKKEVISPEYIIQKALNVILKKYSGINVPVRYHYQHSRMVEVDAMKIHKVCTSVIDSMMRAMELNSSLVFATQELNSSAFILFCVRVTGIYLNENETSKFFDWFHTPSGKLVNDLNLSISRQIVTAHGGKIWCRSSKEDNYIEIFFTLPKSA